MYFKKGNMAHLPHKFHEVSGCHLARQARRARQRIGPSSCFKCCIVTYRRQLIKMNVPWLFLMYHALLVCSTVVNLHTFPMIYCSLRFFCLSVSLHLTLFALCLLPHSCVVVCLTIKVSSCISLRFQLLDSDLSGKTLVLWIGLNWSWASRIVDMQDAYSNSGAAAGDSV